MLSLLRPVLRRGRLLVWAVLLGALPVHAAQLVLYTEENPPLNFSQGGELSGFSTEVVRALAERTGDGVRIELGPWTRGYGKAMTSANSGVFSIARIAGREKAFQWVGPLVQTRNRFYTHKGAGLRIDSLEQAARAGRLVLLRNWYTHEYLSARGFTDLYTVTAPDKMMQMFGKRRADLLAASELALPALLAMAGMTPEQVEPQFVFLEHQSYLAFSPATAPAIVARWQAALDEMKRAGEFGELYRRWFPDLPLPAALLSGSPLSPAEPPLP
ncbi:substrate-binding periplasmic protein [Pseudomonas benzenivorans]|uniref:substrate-binding periplasmic protein n=1 Tax=Pseudomonas benzenivorans TaxID=556533 RepID=UPI002107D67E|nr:transporter substrate-binding domain-containing protein [Pseudomonas benzenivorans]